MLIQFEVENYLSIRDLASLQLTAINYYKEQSSGLIDIKLPGLAGSKFLRVAAIYGPNASGKSTFLRAIREMRSAVLGSFRNKAGEPLPFRPFMLDNESRKRPTYFGIAFVANDVRYEYSFSYTERAIESEELCSFPNGYKQIWFSRSDDEVKGSSHIKVPSALEPLLNDNTLLLSLLANYPKYSDSQKIAPVYQWFQENLEFINRGPGANIDYPFSGEIVAGAQGNDNQRAFIQNMIKKADVGIEKARVESAPLPEDDLKKFEKLAEALDIDSSAGGEFKYVLFDHASPKAQYSVQLSDESDGTIQLFCLSGHIAQTLEKGSILFVDELDASLHSVLVRELIRCFLDPAINPNNAQLVFTAHNPCLLENGILRRDQVWFTEKGPDGATAFYPLSDFRPRKGESIASGYLTGRYSATPVVPKCFGLCENVSRSEEQ